MGTGQCWPGMPSHQVPGLTWPSRVEECPDSVLASRSATICVQKSTVVWWAEHGTGSQEPWAPVLTLPYDIKQMAPPVWASLSPSIKREVGPGQYNRSGICIFLSCQVREATDPGDLRVPSCCRLLGSGLPCCPQGLPQCLGISSE